MYTLTLLQKKYLTHSVLELSFIKPDEFNYQPGQFVTLELGDGRRRFFSIASHPTEPTLKIIAKLVDTGVASQLFKQAKAGDTFVFSGPAGYFTPQRFDRPILMITTGVGLSPMLSHIKEFIHRRINSPLELWFGVKNEPAIFVADELQRFKEKHPNFNYIIALSQPNSSTVHFVGRVTRLLEKRIDNYLDRDFYLCGSPGMIKDCLVILKGHNVPDSQIFREYFTPASR